MRVIIKMMPYPIQMKSATKEFESGVNSVLLSSAWVNDAWTITPGIRSPDGPTNISPISSEVAPIKTILSFTGVVTFPL